MLWKKVQNVVVVCGEMVNSTSNSVLMNQGPGSAAVLSNTGSIPASMLTSQGSGSAPMLTNHSQAAVLTKQRSDTTNGLGIPGPGSSRLKPNMRKIQRQQNQSLDWCSFLLFHLGNGIDLGTNQYTGQSFFMVAGNITTRVNKGRQAGTMSSLLV